MRNPKFGGRASLPAILIICTIFAGVLEARAPLDQEIETAMKESGATSVGIYYEDPSGRVYEYNADEIFHAASTMKVAVMMEVFWQVEAATLKLDQPVMIKNEFKSIMDGSPFSLTPEDDDDKDLYKQIGQTLPLQNLIQRMINTSSNFATNLIIQLVSAKKVMELMGEIGAKSMTVLRGVEDIKAYDAGKNNTTSARALATCMKTIANSDLYSAQSRKAMLEILLSQHSRNGIPAGIRSTERGLQVASKDGWITEIHHDSAIIRDSSGHNSYLVILTRGVKEELRGQKLVATLAGMVWDRLSYEERYSPP